MDRLERRYTQVQSDLSGDSASAKRPFAKALQCATWGRTGRIADALGLSQSTVEKWGEPYAPQHGPLWQLAVVMREALDAGADESDALAPLRLLNRLFERDSETETLLRSAAKAAREANEAVAVAVEAAEDKRIDADELDRIEREADQGIAKFEQLKRAARAAAGNVSAFKLA